MPDIPHDKPRWKSAHDMAAEPQAARRQRQVVARNRRLKRYIKSTAELVVGAAAAGDITGLRQWMAVDDSYCNCEAALPYANSLTAPLLEAAKHGHVECCQLLMRRGARVDDLTGAAPGWSALMEGAAAGNVAIVNALCGFGANPLVANRTGSTALSLAAAQGHAGVTAELLALGGLLPRAVARAAAGLTAVASALDALEPVRKAMAEKDRALWLQGRRCGAAKLASKRAKQAYEKRQANRESRIQSAKHAIAGFMWFAAANLQLRRDFFGWRAVTATHTAEKAQRRDMELQTRYNHAYAEQELALPATASARQDLDEAVETVHRLVATALQRLELAKARAGVVGQMFAHQDTDGLTPVCQAAVSKDVPTIKVMATCGAGTPGNHSLPTALATAYAHKAFAAYRSLRAAQHAAERPDTPQRPFDLGVLLHLRDDTYELEIGDDDDDGDGLEHTVADHAHPLPLQPVAVAPAGIDKTLDACERDSGAWWGSWIGSCGNFHEVQQRCDAALAALQPVTGAADAAAGTWESGPEKRGRDAALKQQSRRLHRELTMRSMAGERAADRANEAAATAVTAEVTAAAEEPAAEPQWPNGHACACDQ